MEIVSLSRFARSAQQGSVATIGNFDGVHLGHVAVLDELLRQARRLRAAASVITFEPLPQEFFGRQTARLTRFRERCEALAQLPIDYLVCLRFNHRLAQTSAAEFIDKVLVEALSLRHLVVGDDFRFGRDREGDFSMLESVGENFGFGVQPTESFLIDGERVSSTLVRESLRCGDIAKANRLLGRPYRISGRVRTGERRGRSIGFPTANLAFGNRPPPLNGVFAVNVFLESGEIFAGVANAGVRPTVNGSEYRIETHIFDFDADIYRQRIGVECKTRLRDERRFESLNALREQIAIDADNARQYFAGQKRH
jgi:riboflavin kinase / FMN adenylyltransferase